ASFLSCCSRCVRCARAAYPSNCSALSGSGPAARGCRTGSRSTGLILRVRNGRGIADSLSKYLSRRDNPIWQAERDNGVMPAPTTTSVFATEGKALAAQELASGDLEVTGYAAVWEGLDASSENFLRGSFRKAIPAALAVGIPLVFHHQTDKILG